jgi:hypothetical protein
MDVSKKMGTVLFTAIAIAVIGYKFCDGWLINPPQPRVFEADGKVWVAEPASAFMHYLFGSEIICAARQNSVTGHYEYQKNGQWISVPILE